MKQHIEEFLHNFRIAGPRYAKLERYYRGDHDLAFATEKFANTFGSLFREFALNLCPIICDAVRDKLRINGFAHRSSSITSDAALSDRAISAASDIWDRNRMPIRSAEVHREALLNGDAYIIVWPDDKGKAVLHPNRAAFCSAIYDDEHPGHILRAAKYWRMTNGHTRLNIFYPDRIERFVTANAADAILPLHNEFVPLAQKDGGVTENPFGVVPVFHFANNADIGAFGRSELEPALPVQDGMNKSVLDMLVAMEFSAYRQRWAAGIEIKFDNEGNAVAPFKAGIDHIWISENPDARFGDFHTVELDQFIKVKDSFRVDMASVTGTPMYYLMPHTRGFPSGEALSRAEARFESKVRSRQICFGQTWSDAMEFALRIETKKETQLAVLWENDR